jgi:hypothetical protein
MDLNGTHYGTIWLTNTGADTELTVQTIMPWELFDLHWAGC